MATTYVKIATTTLTTTTETVTFSSIAATYTDLRLIMNGQGNNQFFMRFNSDATALYSTTGLKGVGTAVTASRESGSSQGISIAAIGQGLGIGQPTFFAVDIFSYAATTTFKSVLATGSSSYVSAANGVVSRNAGVYRSTNAITSVSCYNGAVLPNSFSSGATFTLYGILKA